MKRLPDMTRDDILRMAREAGFVDESFCRWGAYSDDIERFANLVAAAEREACAKLCDEIDDGREDLSAKCAEAIRARGEK